MSDTIPEKILRKSDLSLDEMLLLKYFRDNPTEQENILEKIKELQKSKREDD